VIKNTLNPVWNERIWLLVQVGGVGWVGAGSC
jgi:Ca2+-dependent lipid-binding protein